ncbi:MAG: hypothetical protein WA373_11965 [Burkholderiales bacterium]
MTGVPAAGSLLPRRLVVTAYLGDNAHVFTGTANSGETFRRHLEAMRDSVRSFHALTDSEILLAKAPALKMIIATETTRFAEPGRNSPLGRNAGSTLRLVNAMVTDGKPASVRTIKVVE